MGRLRPPMKIWLCCCSKAWAGHAPWTSGWSGFLTRFGGHHYIVDAMELGLGALDEEVAEYFNALLLHPISKQFISAMGDVRMHPMTYRRYMWKFDY